MQSVGPGLEDNVSRATGVAPAFGSRGGLHGKFLSCVNRQDRACNPGDATLIDGRNVVPEIVVVHAVDLPIDLIGAGAIERAEAAHVITAEARGYGNQLGEVAAVQRN